MAESDLRDTTGSWAVTRLHNAMVIIEVDDATILTDPWFVDSRAFRGYSPVGVGDLPELTAIIGSHWVRDHWGVAEMEGFPRKDTPVYVCNENMETQARKYGFTAVETLEWNGSRPLTDTVTLTAVEEHVGRGNRTSNYAIVGSTAKVFFGGEVLNLDAVRRSAATYGPFDVAIGPVNGVHLLGRQLTVTAEQMLEAARILGAPTLIPIHDEHRAFRPLLKVASSARDLHALTHDDVEVLELDFGERYVHRAA